MENWGSLSNNILLIINCEAFIAFQLYFIYLLNYEYNISVRLNFVSTKNIARIVIQENSTNTSISSQKFS